MLMDLPDAVNQSIVSFCGYKDTLEIALVNTRFLAIVETHFQQQLAIMRTTHQADEDWDRRLTVLVAQDANGLPTRFSNRHRFKCAQQVNFYSLGARDDTSATYYYKQMCLPERNMLISLGENTSIPGEHVLVHFWDLATKERVRSFDLVLLPPNAEQIQDIHMTSEHIVISDFSTLYIFTLEGDLLHRLEVEHHLFAISGNKVFSLGREEYQPPSPLVASLVDIPSGEQQHHFFEPKGQSCAAVGKWVVVLARRVSIAIFDFMDSNFAPRRIHFDEYSEEIWAASDGSPIFVSLGYNGHLTVYRIVDDGSLVRVNVFPLVAPAEVDLDMWMTGSPMRLFVYGSRLYVSSARLRKKNVIDVFDIRTREKVKSLHYPRHEAYRYLSSFASNGRELFVGFSRNPDDGIMYRHLPSIQVYPL